MRPYGMVLTTLLLAGLPALAQQPAPPAAPAKPDPQALDGYLKRWEQEMQRVRTLAAKLNRVEKDPVTNQVQKYTGIAAYMKVGDGATAQNLALLEMNPEGKPGTIAEKFICTGTYLYEYSPAQKEIRAHELPRPKPGQVADDNFLNFLFGMKAEQARRRYDLKLEKENQWYIYVLISPRTPQDRADFQQARIVLYKSNYLPAQLWFKHANGSEVTWEIPRIDRDVNLNRRAFDKPETPKDWKLVPVKHDQQPRVMRGTK